MLTNAIRENRIMYLNKQKVLHHSVARRETQVLVFLSFFYLISTLRDNITTAEAWRIRG